MLLHMEARMDYIKGMRDRLERVGNELLSDEWVGSKGTYRIRCRKCGVERDLKYSILIQIWLRKIISCSICNNRKTLTIENMKRVAGKKGGDCLSETYMGEDVKHKWRCHRGHEWMADYSQIRRGRWCPECKLIKLRSPDGETKVSEQAVKNGLELLDEYTGISKKRKYRCSAGHEFEACNPSGGCPICRAQSIIDKKKELAEIRIARAGERRRRKEAAIEEKAKLRQEKISNKIKRLNEIGSKLASERGGKLLSDIPNTYAKVKWRCANGHEWETSLNNIQCAESWCPNCIRRTCDSKGERRFRAALEEIIGAKFPKGYPDWLVNPKTKRILELDGYNEKLKLAFEYDGGTHAEDFRFKSDKDKVDTVYKDELKRELCRQNGVLLLEPNKNIKIKDLEKWIRRILIGAGWKY